jgi:hypothetical protein
MHQPRYSIGCRHAARATKLGCLRNINNVGNVGRKLCKEWVDWTACFSHPPTQLYNNDHAESRIVLHNKRANVGNHFWDLPASQTHTFLTHTMRARQVQFNCLCTRRLFHARKKRSHLFKTGLTTARRVSSCQSSLIYPAMMLAMTILLSPKSRFNSRIDSSQ